MCKITVIMPSLNVVKYIAKCMDSVISQTMNDLEIIAIDAGSTDGTMEIIQSYADRDSRIRFIQSDRKSYGYQINLGLSMAQGEYIGIVETDDWIESDTYETLYDYACKYKADYVRGVAEFYKETEKGQTYGLPINIFPKETYDDNDGIIQVNPQCHRELLIKDVYLWNGIYKRDFLHGIILNETAGAAYQDVGFLMQIYYKAANAIYINKLIYHYRKDNEDSSCYSRNAFHYLIEEYKFVHEHIAQEDKEWALWNDVRYFNQVYVRFILMAETGSYWAEAETYIEEIRDFFCEKQDISSLLSETLWNRFELFIESPVKLYEFLREEYVRTQSSWEDFLHKLDNRKVVIFGSGKRGYFLQFLLTKKNVGHIQGYCDNDSNKIGKDIFGLKVRSLDDWVKTSDDICYIVTARAASDEIVRQLITNGILQDNIVLFELPLDFSVL